MHPDRKIGIAMGILLIGVVAALFFRNEPLATDEGLTADREQQLNERLRDRDVTVFLDDADNTSVPPEDPAPQWSMPELLGTLSAQEDEVPIPIGGPRLTVPSDRHESSLSEGATIGSSSAGASVDDQPADDRSPNSPGRSSGDIAAAVDKPVADRPAAEPEFIEYTVQIGDTLSEISEKFLGSQSRFREIYELNKDRMQSPDRLRVGKAIRIPRTYH